MSRTGILGTEPRQSTTRVVTAVSAVVSLLAAVALLVLVGGEAASGAGASCTTEVRQGDGGLAHALCGSARASAASIEKKR